MGGIKLIVSRIFALPYNLSDFWATLVLRAGGGVEGQLFFSTSSFNRYFLMIKKYPSQKISGFDNNLIANFNVTLK